MCPHLQLFFQYHVHVNFLKLINAPFPLFQLTVRTLHFSATNDKMLLGACLI